MVGNREPAGWRKAHKIWQEPTQEDYLAGIVGVSRGVVGGQGIRKEAEQGLWVPPLANTSGGASRAEQ